MPPEPAADTHTPQTPGPTHPTHARAHARTHARKQTPTTPSNRTAPHPTHPRSAGDTPGLEELYLSAMDAVEALTPGAALFLVQGSTAAEREAAPGGVRPYNGFNLTMGGPRRGRGFV
jgi:hypothetical protein